MVIHCICADTMWVDKVTNEVGHTERKIAVDIVFHVVVCLLHCLSLGIQKRP